MNVVMGEQAKFTSLLSLLILCWSMGLKAMETAEAHHLLMRSGFGATPQTVADLSALRYEEALSGLLAGMRTTTRTSPPEWVHQFPDQKHRQNSEEITAEKRKLINQQRQLKSLQLKSWWIREMMQTDSPLTERLVLFWHNHFTSSLRQVRWPELIYQQNKLFRKHLLGNYREFLESVTFDPAMVIYLDSQNNRAGKPNENYARELLELFTLGEGHYSEDDIKGAALALTGISINRRSGDVRILPRRHSRDEKYFLGQRGNFGPKEIINIILAQPRAAEHLVEKLWREFISPYPERSEVERLAALFRDGDYELRPLMKALFNSKSFRDPNNYGQLIKSPIEMVVGAVELFDLSVAPEVLVQAVRIMGQDILDPPSVKGWPGGKEWINSQSLVERQKFLLQLVRGEWLPGEQMLVRKGLIDTQRRERQASLSLWDKQMAAGVISLEDLHHSFLGSYASKEGRAELQYADRRAAEAWLNEIAFQLK